MNAFLLFIAASLLLSVKSLVCYNCLNFDENDASKCVNPDENITPNSSLFDPSATEMELQSKGINFTEYISELKENGLGEPCRVCMSLEGQIDGQTLTTRFCLGQMPAVFNETHMNKCYSWEPDDLLQKGKACFCKDDFCTVDNNQVEQGRVDRLQCYNCDEAPGCKEPDPEKTAKICKPDENHIYFKMMDPEMKAAQARCENCVEMNRGDERSLFCLDKKFYGIDLPIASYTEGTGNTTIRYCNTKHLCNSRDPPTDYKSTCPGDQDVISIGSKMNAHFIAFIIIACAFA